MSADAIDLVYLWVDGTDPEFQKLKRRYMSPAQLAARTDDEHVGDSTRYVQMNEIVYAVRSARRYAPWIRNIHIVITDGQKLPDEVLATPNVNVVPYSQVVPAELLPTFASPSIEPFLHKIPGLSDIFLYANDDYLFWKPTPRSYFVRGDQLVLRGYLQPRILARLGELRQGHMRIANRSATLLYEHGWDRVYMPEHSYHVMRKASCEALWEEFHDEMWASVQPKFRADDVALAWQLMVYALEDKHHEPIHELTFVGAHLSFADVEKSRVMRAYVSSRLFLLSRFRSHTVCFNTIPPSWHDRMHRYFATNLGQAGRGEDDVPLLAPSAE